GRAVGASLRNFGFVTVTGQQRGTCWRRARRSREVWAEVAPQAGIPVEHEGLVFAARSPEALAGLEAFLDSDAEMAAGCALLEAAEAVRRYPQLRRAGLHGALWSPHELRVDPRLAVDRLAAWLSETHAVEIRYGVTVTGVDNGWLQSDAGPIHAGAVVVCPGADLQGLYRQRLAGFGLTKCKLHMLRLAPQPSGWRLPGGVMTDPSIPRYLGYAELPAARAVRARLERERPELLEMGIHLIVTQDADGSLVVGDSHHYGDPPMIFQDERVDRAILDLAVETLELPERRVVARWTGVYPSHPSKLALIDAPEPRVRLVLVTSGTGMSTAFALGEEVVDDLAGDGLNAGAVIFDWAGTVVDHGSRAPMGAFVAAFGRFGVDLSIAQARRPMGLPKRDHIKALLEMPEVAAGWQAAQGGSPDEAAIDRLYEVFVPMNAEVVARHAELIPGAAETVAALRAAGLKIGSTTGYVREIMARLTGPAAAQGFAPDNLVCAGDLPEGRPSPFNIYRTLLDLQVWPAAACVKIDDTEPGIAEGVNAGCWTVGVALTGNTVGLTAEELAALPAAEVAGLRARATARLKAAGAHLVVDGVADLQPALADLEGRLARGQRP
ncbi:phnX, partial [Symbiodinium necroappetens]